MYPKNNSLDKGNLVVLQGGKYIRLLKFKATPHARLRRTHVNRKEPWYASASGEMSLPATLQAYDERTRSPPVVQGVAAPHQTVHSDTCVQTHAPLQRLPARQPHLLRHMSRTSPA